MTAEQAQRLGGQVLGAGLDAHILPIEDGRAYCVRILQPQWHCFSPEDWRKFHGAVKKPRKHKAGEQDQEAQHAINAAEPYHLALG